MEDTDAQKQIDQMVKFILNEAKDKAAEIEAKSMEDFNIEKLKLVQQMKEKIRNEYRKKAKQVETEKVIARSTAVNKARLKKIAARQLKINEAVRAASKSLMDLSIDTYKYPKLCCDLIVQSMLKLLEDSVIVRVREDDVHAVSSILSQAEKRYLTILNEAGISKRSVKITLDEKVKRLTVLNKHP